MAYGKRLLWQEQASTSAATINAAGANYTSVGSFSFPARHVLLTNNTDVSVQVSWNDDSKDAFPMLAGSQLILDISTNKQNHDPFFAGKGDTIYVKALDPASLPSSGNFYFSASYGKGD